MTMTDEELELRLRRDLAELGALPPAAPRERRAAGRNRPMLTMAVALAVVLVLIGVSVAIAWSGDTGNGPAGPLPRVHTILEQPASVTGSSISIVAKPFTQVCEGWRILPSGVDCMNLQAHYVWSPGARKGPYTFSVIEDVGRPDKKLDLEGTVKGAYPLFKTVSVRGNRARLFGMPNVGEAGDVVTMVWNERPDLQVWIHVEANPTARRYPTALMNEILAFARGMRRVAIDPAQSTYVIRSGANPLEFTQPNFQPGPWTLTWRPSDRRLCTSAEFNDKCFKSEGLTATKVRAQDVRLEGCVNAWVGTQGVVFGIAPEAAHRMAVSFTNTDDSARAHVTTPVFVPPYAPHLRVFAAALVHPLSATVTALDAAGRPLPRGAQTSGALPGFPNGC